jgi:hypothetical protein
MDFSLVTAAPAPLSAPDNKARDSCRDVYDDAFARVGLDSVALRSARLRFAAAPLRSTSGAAVVDRAKRAEMA